MWTLLKKLGLGLSLIAAAAAVLLISDWGRRVPRPAAKIRVAILQYSSRPLMDENVQGMIDGLAAEGFVDGERIALTRFNAENDLPTANTIAREIVGGGYRLVLTSSTPCLQTMANANKAGKLLHVFGAVTDPYGAGVGITGEGPDEHPPHLVGVGTFQPVAPAFQIARQLFPALSKVGTVWNPAEACSEACLVKARRICGELGIELLEAAVDSSAGVLEAAHSVVARGAEALWVGGDNTVELAIDSVLNAAGAAGIPVFGHSPGIVDRGLLFALGADYYEVGMQAGRLAAQILGGADPRTIGVRDFVPERLVINTSVIATLHADWRVPADLIARAGADAAPAPAPAGAAAAAPRPVPGRTYKLGFVYFAPDPGAELVMNSLLDALRDQGLIEGTNLTVQRAHAQGEIANITPILQSYDNSDLDLIVTLTTPCLTAACAGVKTKPVVFAYVYDPIAAGAAESLDKHLPHITGVGSFPPVADTVAAIKELVPGVTAVGTLYNSAEANSRKVVEVARDRFGAAGIRLEEVTISTSSDVHQAAQALAQRQVDLFWITGDNTALIAFEGIVNVANRAKLPLVINDVEFTERGATVAVGIGFGPAGYRAGELAARVLCGAAPAAIPIEQLSVKRVAVNLTAAAACGVEIPPALLREAELVIGLDGRLGRPARVFLVRYSDTPLSEDATEGVGAGMAKAGLAEGRDYTLEIRSAQGDVSTLNTILDAIKGEGADLVMVLSTPTLQAALRKFDTTPIVFSVVADAIVAGAGTSPTDHRPNVTGLTTEAAFELMPALLKECMPKARRVGTLFTPGEANSVHNKDQLAAYLKAAGVELDAVPVNSSAEVNDAALALCSRGIEAVCQSIDNLTSGSFSTIARAAERAGLPLFGFVSAQAGEGAVAVLARDYHEAGAEAALIAARVLRGEDPAGIPFARMEKARLIVNPGAARKAGLTLPASLLDRADQVIP